MRLDGYLSFHLVQPFIRSGLYTADPGIPVLMYHSITEDAESDRRNYYKVCTPPALFREHLRILKEEAFSVVDISSAIAALKSGASHRLAVITFDDGYRDFLTEAWPSLSDSGFCATVFLPTRFITSQRSTFQNRDCLTWDEVRILRREGVSFGSHTVSHPRLVDLDEALLQEELSESKQTIENELGEGIDLFSHPYAFPQADRDYIHRFRTAVIRSGYRAAVTTRLGRVRHGDDPLILKRLPVNGADDADLFRAKLMGAYDWLHAPQQAMQWIKRSKRFLARHR
jgi:peptidoglycan/xylan/chitin deacetylase (PgdA/CDA1 family)